MMTHNLVPHTPAETIVRLDDVQPGQFWTMVRDEHGEPIEQPLTLLVTEARVVDGTLHTVVVHDHPTRQNWRGDQTIRFLASDFFDQFERADNADAIREQEMAAVMTRLTGYQLELANANVQASPAQQLQLGLQSQLQTDLNSIDSLPTVAQTQAVHTQLDNLRARVEESKSKVTAVVAKISSDTELLTRFMQEKSTAVLSGISSTIALANDLTKSLNSFNIFNGTDVDVKVLREGKRAQASDRITLYRDMHYMDEELVIFRDIHGGADFSSWSDFRDALHDDSFLNHILPTPKCVILLRVRREDRIYYSSGNPIADAFANDQLNQQNRLQFLLIRNGENVQAVWSELSSQSLTGLFPAQNEDFSFRGVNSSEINFRDLAYTDSRKAHDDSANTYKRALLLLYGLQVRENMLGPFDGPTNFLDLQFQLDHFHFIDLSQTFDSNIPCFSTWLEEHNKNIGKGSTVLLNLNLFWNSAHVPGAFSYSDYHSEYRQIWKPECASWLALKLEGSGAKLGAKVRGIYDGWKYEARDKERSLSFFWHRQPTKYVSRSNDYSYEPRERRANHMLLDGVDPELLERMFYARFNRVEYLKNYDLLRAALAYTKREYERVKDDIAVVLPLLTQGTDAERRANAFKLVQRWYQSNKGCVDVKSRNFIMLRDSIEGSLLKLVKTLPDQDRLKVVTQRSNGQAFAYYHLADDVPELGQNLIGGQSKLTPQAATILSPTGDERIVWQASDANKWIWRPYTDSDSDYMSMINYTGERLLPQHYNPDAWGALNQDYVGHLRKLLDDFQSELKSQPARDLFVKDIVRYCFHSNKRHLTFPFWSAPLGGIQLTHKYPIWTGKKNLPNESWVTVYAQIDVVCWLAQYFPDAIETLDKKIRPRMVDPTKAHATNRVKNLDLLTLSFKPLKRHSPSKPVALTFTDRNEWIKIESLTDFQSYILSDNLQLTQLHSQLGLHEPSSKETRP